MSRSKPERTRKSAPLNWRRLLPPRALVTSAMVGALGLAALAGFVFGEAPLKRLVAERRAGPIQFSIEWPPLAGDARRTWLPESTRREITAAAVGRLSPDPFDQRSLDDARDALLRTGWFSAVTSVRRRPDNRVIVEAEWRTPKAVVRWDGKDHVVAAGGELLPIVYPSGGAGAMHIIEGVSSAPPTRAGPGGAEEPAYGVAWVGGEVQAALALLRTLDARFHHTGVWTQVAGIDVSRFQRSGTLAIVSDTGSRVIWGGAPGVIVPGEQSTEQKLQRLARLAKGPTGRIDANEKLVEIHGAHVFIDQSAAPAPGPAGPASARVPVGG